MNIRLIYCLLFTLMITGLPHPAASATQEPKPQEQKDTGPQDKPVQLKSELMEIRAVVKDKKGKTVEGLTKEDFEVLENDKPQPVSFFSFERVGDASGADETRRAVPNLKTQRTVVLFIDTLNMDYEDPSRVKPALKKFISEQMTDGDMVAIITTSGMLGLMEQYTRNRSMLHMATERIKNLTGKQFLNGVEVPGGKFMEQFIEPEVLGQLARVKGYQTDVKRKYTLGIIMAVIKSLAEMPGQRLFINFSPGFTLRNDLFGGLSFDTTQIENIIEYAVRAGVVIYSINPGGLQAPSMSGPDPIAEMEEKMDAENVLNTLAHDTGGKFFRNTGDMNRVLQKALDDNRAFYTLAYYPTLEAGDNKLRNIKVRVKGHPEYEVRAQRGYSPAALRKKAEKEQSLTPEQRITKALASPIPLTEIGVIASVTVLKAKGDRAAVALQSYIDGEGLDYKQQGKKQALQLELYTSVYDARGKLVHGFKDKVEADLTGARAEQLKQNGLTNVRQMELKPGLYNIRVGVKEASTERVGTAIAWVEVPEVKKARLAMGGILLTEQGTVNNKTGKAEIILPKAVAGVPVFKRGNTLLFGAMVFANAGGKVAGEDLQVQVELLAGGKSVYKEPVQPVSAMQTGRDESGIQIGGQVLMQMPAGMYELRIVIENPKAKSSVVESALFRVDA